MSLVCKAICCFDLDLFGSRFMIKKYIFFTFLFLFFIFLFFYGVATRTPESERALPEQVENISKRKLEDRTRGRGNGLG